jgi:hypothetical protein
MVPQKWGVGSDGIEPATHSAAVLQTVAHTSRRADLLVVLTGVEPAFPWLKATTLKPISGQYYDFYRVNV